MRPCVVGDVQYGDRTLHFTRDYLSGLVDAFRDRAYDAVSFQLAPGDNKHTNDPERHQGQITDLELADDWLWMYLQPTEAGERVLSENPYLGVSARIVENYARSDGKFYPAAIQHVLGTLDPACQAWGPGSPRTCPTAARCSSTCPPASGLASPAPPGTWPRAH